MLSGGVLLRGRDCAQRGSRLAWRLHRRRIQKSRHVVQSFNSSVARATEPRMGNIVESGKQGGLVDAAKTPVGLLFQFQDIVPLADGVLRPLEFCNEAFAFGRIRKLGK